MQHGIRRRRHVNRRQAQTDQSQSQGAARPDVLRTSSDVRREVHGTHFGNGTAPKADKSRPLGSVQITICDMERRWEGPRSVTSSSTGESKHQNDFQHGGGSSGDGSGSGSGSGETKDYDDDNDESLGPTTSTNSAVEDVLIAIVLMTF